MLCHDYGDKPYLVLKVRSIYLDARYGRNVELEITFTKMFSVERESDFEVFFSNLLGM